MNFDGINEEYQEDIRPERERMQHIIEKLKEENSQLRSFIRFLKPHIVSLVAENSQLKETVESYSSSNVLGSIFSNQKVTPFENSQNIDFKNHPASKKIKLEMEEDWASMEQSWNNLNSNALLRNLATKKAKKVWKKFFAGEEIIQNNLNALDMSNIEGFGTRIRNLTKDGILNPTPYLCSQTKPESEFDDEWFSPEILRGSGKEKALLELNPWKESGLSINSVVTAKQNHQKKKRRIVKRRGWKKTVIGPRKRRRVDFMCSKCGVFKACPSLANPNRVQHNCGELPEPQTTNTLGKVHRRTGALVVLGKFTEQEMEIKLKEAMKATCRVSNGKHTRKQKFSCSETSQTQISDH